MKESVIASDLTIEGKIIGSGHIRIAGRFKGDVQVDGNVTLDTGAHLEGQVKASVVVVGGELHRQHRERQARRAARRRRHQRRRQGRVAHGGGRLAHARPGRVRLGGRDAQQGRDQGLRQRMNVASRPVAPGKTRTCPHCKAAILESLSICPGCLHHLRFDQEAAKRQVAATSALRVEGVIRHPPLEEPWEYFVVIADPQRPRRGSGAPGGQRRRPAGRREAHLHALGRNAAAAGRRVATDKVDTSAMAPRVPAEGAARGNSTARSRASPAVPGQQPRGDAAPLA